MGRRCILEEECRNMTQGYSVVQNNWKLLNNKCVLGCPSGYIPSKKDKHKCEKCAGKCPKICGGMVIDNVAAAQKLKGCVVINGILEIQIRGGSHVGRELEENLGMIEEVTHYVKIVRSYAIVSLRFLMSLKVIHGKQLYTDRPRGVDRETCHVGHVGAELEANLQDLDEVTDYVRVQQSNALTDLNFLAHVNRIRGKRLYLDRYALFVLDNQSLVICHLHVTIVISIVAPVPGTHYLCWTTRALLYVIFIVISIVAPVPGTHYLCWTTRALLYVIFIVISIVAPVPGTHYLCWTTRALLYVIFIVIFIVISIVAPVPGTHYLCWTTRALLYVIFIVISIVISIVAPVPGTHYLCWTTRALLYVIFIVIFIVISIVAPVPGTHYLCWTTRALLYVIFIVIFIVISIVAPVPGTHYLCWTTRTLLYVIFIVIFIVISIVAPVPGTHYLCWTTRALLYVIFIVISIVAPVPGTHYLCWTTRALLYVIFIVISIVAPVPGTHYLCWTTRALLYVIFIVISIVAPVPGTHYLCWTTRTLLYVIFIVIFIVISIVAPVPGTHYLCWTTRTLLYVIFIVIFIVISIVAPVPGTHYLCWTTRTLLYVIFIVIFIVISIVAPVPGTHYLCWTTRTLLYVIFIVIFIVISIVAPVPGTHYLCWTTRTLLYVIFIVISIVAPVPGTHYLCWTTRTLLYVIFIVISIVAPVPGTHYLCWTTRTLLYVIFHCHLHCCTCARYALFVLDNQNLQEVWHVTKHPNLTIHNGKVFFHHNRKLCLNKIEEFIRSVGLENVTEEKDVSRTSNGDQVACDISTLKLDVIHVASTFAFIRWNNFHTNDHRELLSWVVNYREALEQNVTLFNARDACGSDVWKTVDVRPEIDASAQFVGTILILKPYTQYALYVQTYTIATANTGAMSAITYLKTKPDIPTPARDIRVQARLPGELQVTWKEPSQTNGNVTHYYIYWQPQAIHPAKFDQRDYCKDRLRLRDRSKEESRKTDPLPPPTYNEQCCECPKSKKEQRVEEEERQFQIKFENFLHDSVYFKRDPYTDVMSVLSQSANETDGDVYPRSRPGADMGIRVISIASPSPQARPVPRLWPVSSRPTSSVPCDDPCFLVCPLQDSGWPRSPSVVVEQVVC
ncbi:hypothetical protein NP493_91g05005 [Ridgeia piscesae]|uniref:Uncharacterized protein n=1 Tax=Ridgeia piscesae TaxID=27915 RepID=A0AAD9P8J9_RIDPI|nr:hypothetical protein NP493_91g05005 [Ridgeia piscesae]